jgi:hypothetical protein
LSIPNNSRHNAAAEDKPIASPHRITVEML